MVMTSRRTKNYTDSSLDLISPTHVTHRLVFGSFSNPVAAVASKPYGRTPRTRSPSSGGVLLRPFRCISVSCAELSAPPPSGRNDEGAAGATEQQRSPNYGLPKDPSKTDVMLEEALVSGNVTFAKCICGDVGALTEFCVRGNVDAVRRILYNHPELCRTTQDIIPEAGTPIPGSKRVLSHQEWNEAVALFVSVRQEIQISLVFASHDMKQLEAFYAENLESGIVEACRRNDLSAAKALCKKLFRQTPSYRQRAELGMFPHEPLWVQELLLKVHQETCKACDAEDLFVQKQAYLSKADPFCSIM